MNSKNDAVLRLENLNVAFGGEPAVRGVSLEIRAGECLALVGESGSGKSVTARALIGLAGAGAKVSTDRLELSGRNLAGLSQRAWQQVRGSRIGFILQDALVSLDPLRTIGREIDDALRLGSKDSRRDRARRILSLLEDVGLDNPAQRAGQRSGELSGGMRQRALIASAIALDPELIIADEPTTALDATVQAQILDLLAALRERGSAMLLISHDLAVVESVADRVAVMTEGRIVELGPAAQVLGSPRHEYTRKLLRAVPADHPRGTRLSASPEPADQTASHVSGRAAAGAAETPGGSGASAGPAAAGQLTVAARMQADKAPAAAPVLQAAGLTKSFRTPDKKPFTAVDSVSFELAAGETLGLVGESGSGKTTAARLVLGLAEPDGGEVRLFGQPWSGLPERERRSRRALIGAVYQDPLSSFDPRLTVGQLLADALSGGRSLNPKAQAADTARLLDLVGLPARFAARGTRTLSGGQRQRVAIARALAPKPRIIICDEPASALDVSVQAQILDLLDDLQREFGLSYLFISHDLGVVRHMSDRVAVMQRGRIVEQGPAEHLFSSPQHAYTQRLLAATVHPPRTGS
ncbi:ABC transporter ATP-binding protein [Arthrobacter sp. Marseille-P9274]|uniref:dipeptide ABC transporter ATP-binding protein n=1 Tax=Arthrobacter sp. Marseille-P9274 TaxID=2866572 RepID=UPI0021C72539|nr:ABC transporter ATP-binding protein [Arthrobacter sp. Marseille-P9274]